MQSTQENINTDNHIKLSLFNNPQWKILAFVFAIPILLPIFTQNHTDPGTAERDIECVAWNSNKSKSATVRAQPFMIQEEIASQLTKHNQSKGRLYSI